MILSEKHHAFLVSSYYIALKENFGQDGIETFIKATKRYGEQRGNRMGLRATEHGYKRDYLGYFTHSEWKPTNEEDFEIKSKIKLNGDIVAKNKKCPWYSAFLEMGMQECGEVYCQYIDKSLVKGFNPELILDVKSLLYTSDCCTFCFRKAKMNIRAILRMKKAEKKYGRINIKSFDYHTAHIYKTFKEVILEDFGSNGKKAVEQAINAFEMKNGKEALEVLLSFENMDFEKI